ncbi:MAG: peptidase M16, partial [Anaerolineae bacterium]|nr:peptidase M16 [Anaerolineae bacterium]
ARIDSDWAGVLADLEAVRAALISRAGLLCNVTLPADEDGLPAFLPQLAGLIETLPTGAGELAVWQPAQPVAPEGLTIPAQVNYVGKAASLYDLGYKLNGAAFVTVKFLDNTWMWDRVRVQGGAYGGFLVFDNLSGVLTYVSYRDPNLLNTLKTYDATASYLREAPLTQSDVDKIIIGVIGQLDSYQLPDAKGFTSMVRHLTGYDDDLRQRLRDEVLATTVADVRSFAGLLDEVARAGSVAVLGSAQAIAAANDSLDPQLVVTPVL